MNKIKMFILYWVHNGIIIYLSHQVFSTNFVLGTSRFTVFISAIVSSLILTLFLELVSICQSGVKKVKLDKKRRFGLFWFANFVGLWLIARFAPLTGFGVTRFTWLIGLSLIVNILQAILPRKSN